MRQRIGDGEAGQGRGEEEDDGVRVHGCGYACLWFDVDGEGLFQKVVFFLGFLEKMFVA